MPQTYLLHQKSAGVPTIGANVGNPGDILEEMMNTTYETHFERETLLEKWQSKLTYWFYLTHFKVTSLKADVRDFFRSRAPRFLTKQELATAKMYGMTLDAHDRLRATAQTQCNHKKGGMIHNVTDSTAILKGLNEGQGGQYSVRKHVMINGDMWIECLRCQRKWKPPIRSEYKTEREFYRAVEEYEAAKKFETNNTTSTSVLCRFELNGNAAAGAEYYRKLVAES